MKARQFLLCAGLCGPALSATAAPVLEGMVIAEQPFRAVTVTVTDSYGLQRTTVTDNEGRYQLDAQG